ncbi:hypothetical protein ACFQ6B_05815 [Streptomyces wedmorensis]|uniref:Uncharacterized protein n=2 Tax=Streptomyces TaxID=1883 RepID=A0A0L8L9U4_STRVR|nr:MULTISPECIES: hypothetical protein [Streptomyces]KOG34912.1 hypothetical protein ADK34_06275 [Streptomyces viridochromogenes]
MGLAQSQHRFHVRQKVTLMANRYLVHTVGPDGEEAELVAFAHQKRMAFKEHVTFYTDESRSQVLFTFKARQVLDVGATYDVHGASGTRLGSFRKDFAASLLRSTWHLSGEGAAGEAMGQERHQGVALLRRLWEFLPFTELIPFAVPYHFDFTAAGRSVMSVDKRFGLRDRYVLDIADPELDRRLAIAQAVALDALQSR